MERFQGLYKILRLVLSLCTAGRSGSSSVFSLEAYEKSPFRVGHGQTEL